MKGYLKNETETQAILKPGNWLHTGDSAYYDETNHFYIVGRLKELIKVKGLQVAPAEIENILKQHSKITDVAVIGIPHDKKGEVPFAFIVKRQALKDDLSVDEIHDFLNGKVAEYKRLAGGIKFVETIPHSAAGKILRKDLLIHYNEHISETRTTS